MLDVRRGSIYDQPRYYDLLFGSDWRAEFDFLRGCFARFSQRPVKRLFEPACGTGRMLARLAAAGYRASGLDLNERMVAFCNDRLRRRGLPATVTVGDMADFRLPRPVDAAYNLISSFQHLADERAALAHLRSIATALAHGGIYVVTLQLAGRRTKEPEAWSVRRGHLALLARMESVGVDLRRRNERVRTTIDVYTPRQQFRLEDENVFRTYTVAQWRRLLAKTPELEVAATFDFAYDIERPIQIDKQSEDAVFVLRKR